MKKRLQRRRLVGNDEKGRNVVNLVEIPCYALVLLGHVYLVYFTVYNFVGRLHYQLVANPVIDKIISQKSVLIIINVWSDAVDNYPPNLVYHSHSYGRREVLGWLLFMLIRILDSNQNTFHKCFGWNQGYILTAIPTSIDFHEIIVLFILLFAFS